MPVDKGMDRTTVRMVLQALLKGATWAFANSID